MSFQISPNLPANVVEIGQELSQAKLDELNAGVLATQSWTANAYAPKASPTFTGIVTIPAGASISGYLTTSVASSTYQTISGMSSYLTTSSASATYATKASPTFTGTVTIPAGASISGYLTTASASSTYQTISGMGSYASISYVSSYVSGQLTPYIQDAPSDGSEYVRKNAAWAVATGGGGGGGISDAPSDGNLYARQNAGWTSFTVPTLSVTNIDLTGNFNGYSMGSGYYTFKFDSTANTLRIQDGAGSGITISPTGITFPNSSVLTSSPSKSVNAITGSYTLALSDANNIIYANSSAGGGMSYYLTVPDDGTTNFPVGTVISLVANSGSGATIDITTTLMGTPTIYGTTSFAGGSVHQAFLTKVAADTWIIK